MIFARAWLWLVVAALMFSVATARDRFDDWIDATEIPLLAQAYSTEVQDRSGVLLRAYTVADGRWRLRTGLDAVDPGYIEMLIRYEDKRFWHHGGVDFLAMSRVFWLALRYQHFVSGGSTLSMQVARLIEEGPTGTVSGKFRQIRLALALERQLSKEEILTLYLNRAPFGGNIEGVRAAAYAWFGKPARRLTPAEAALLVALPQAPESRRPDRHPEAAHRARDRVLARMQGAGILSEEARQAALTEPSPAARRAFPRLAPHLADRARRRTPLSRQIATTLDAGLQARVEALAALSVEAGGERLQIAIVIADHRSGEILASVGSAAFAADAREGYLDMTMALRSPGSALKPLIYGLAFDRGLAHPETLIADRPTDFDGYRPQNFDGLFRGDVRLRQALQQSLNIPAVRLLEAMGPQHLLAGLRRAGADAQLPGGGRPGLAIALGGLGVNLNDLVGLYGALANGGTRIDLRWQASPSAGYVPSAVIGRAAAWHVGDILRGVARPFGPGSGLRTRHIAYKTGTSYGHRDAWAIGYDGAHVIGVWMGRADGTPVPGAFGGGLAAPVLFAAFERLEQPPVPLGPPPPETLIVANVALPAPLQRFGSAADDRAEAMQIVYPPEGAMIEGSTVVARIEGGTAPFIWLANGALIARTNRRELVLPGFELGFSVLAVIDARSRSDNVGFELRLP